MSDDITRWIEFWALLDPERVAIRFEGHDIGYGELLHRIDHLAGRLSEWGAVPGERIAYLGTNRPDVLALTFACARTGTIFVPLNWRLSTVELVQIVRDCTPLVLLCDGEFAAAGAELSAACSVFLIALRPGASTWLEVDRQGRAPRLAGSRVERSTDGLLLLMYTSGTTGSPKGAAHTREGTEWNAQNAIAGYELTGDDVVLVNLPLFHVGGLTMLALPALKAGARLVVHRRFDVAQTLRDIEAQRITMLLAVATTMKAMFEHALWPACDTSSLRLVMTGASIIPPELLKPFFERGVTASQVLGATEMGVGAVLAPRDALRKIGTVGRAALHRTLYLAGPDGLPVDPGSVGEFVFGGPGLMTRYWGDDTATAAQLRDGLFRSGDLGTCDNEGFYTVVSRKKEVIISGGENIYPAEIENVLLASAGVAEVAVVGRTDERWGEVPIAFVVKAAHADVSADDLAARLRASLSRYKQPRELVFVPALPRNAMGKVLRAELRRWDAAHTTNRQETT